MIPWYTKHQPKIELDDFVLANDFTVHPEMATGA